MNVISYCYVLADKTVASSRFIQILPLWMNQAFLLLSISEFLLGRTSSVLKCYILLCPTLVNRCWLKIKPKLSFFSHFVLEQKHVFLPEQMKKTVATDVTFTSLMKCFQFSYR